MKNRSRNTWSDRKGGIVITAAIFAGVVIILVMILFTYPKTLSPSDTVQGATIVVLTLVTIVYAVATWRQAEASQRAVEVALDSEKNAAMPVIEFKIIGFSNNGGIMIDITNQGKGPALNLKVWANLYSEHGEIEITSQVSPLTIAAEGKTTRTELDFLGASMNLQHRSNDMELVAEYKDVFRREFRSEQYRSSISFRHLGESQI